MSLSCHKQLIVRWKCATQFFTISIGRLEILVKSILFSSFENFFKCVLGRRKNRPDMKRITCSLISYRQKLVSSSFRHERRRFYGKNASADEFSVDAKFDHLSEEELMASVSALDSPAKAYVKYATTHRHSMSLPKDGRSLKELEERVDEMIRRLREDEPRQGDEKYLHTVPIATYLVNLTNRQNEFLDVIEKWFETARLLYENRYTCKPSSHLCSLGKMNRYSGGRVIDRLGWQPIEYFVTLMIEIGFHRMDAADVVSALTGMNDLLFFYSPAQKPSLPIFHAFERWLESFTHYLMEKRPRDPDWSKLTRRVAPLSLWFLHDISPDATLVKFPLLTRTLFRLAKIGFDGIAADLRKQKELGKAIDPEDLCYHSVVMTTYPRVFNRFDIDADELAPGSWTSWFELFVLLMHFDRDSILMFNYPFTLAMKFSSFRSTVLWPQIHVVFSGLEEHLRTATPTDKSQAAKRTINFVHNLGQFLDKCSGEKEFIANRRRFQTLASLLRPVLWRLLRQSDLPGIFKVRLDGGFKSLENALDSDSKLKSGRNSNVSS